jgi:hypothetical protein
VIDRILPRDVWLNAAFVGVTFVGLLAFGWPFLSSLVSLSHGALVSIAAGVALGAALALLLLNFAEVRDPKILALIGVLSALAAAARMLSVGAGGIEFIFVVVILAGRVLGPRGGFAVGALGIVVSSLMWVGLARGRHSKCSQWAGLVTGLDSSWGDPRGSGSASKSRFWRVMAWLSPTSSGCS